uniref:Fibrous sheath-interacting protein 1 n=1 Tax=Pogona vitticeps TaxID=103695 RepID=A0ABM5FAG3_9SAUR
MDIIRGSLDEISRPASSSRITHGSKILSASLEILTPEPDLPKVDFLNNHPEDNSKENLDENEAKKFRVSEEISNGNTFELVTQKTDQVEEYSSNSGNSEDDCAVNKLSSNNSPQNQLAELQKVTTKSINQEDAKKKDVDPLILKAIKKMKRLDQILANKQSQEKAVKKQGREMRKKLWEEFECMTSSSPSVIMEEVENTNRFLALTSPLSETPESFAVEEAEMFVSVFHTQIHPENYECDRRTTKQGESYLSEGGARSSIKKIENMHQKTKTSCKKPPDFVKKNIELVKDAANQVVMLEEEKNRLSELLEEAETEGTELQVIEEEAADNLLPGEGYTPEPMEYHHLKEINAKLKVTFSNEDLSSIQSSCSEISKQIFQPDVLPRLSEEQLSALLEECAQTLRRVNNLALTKSQGSFFEGASPCSDIVQNTIPNSRNELWDDVQSGRMQASQEMVASEDNDMNSADMMEACSCNLSKPFIESHLAEKNENNNRVEEKTAHSSTSEGYFMSLALSPDRPKKPSFLDEPFLCISLNNELSTDVNIPSMPVKTREAEKGDSATSLLAIVPF